MKSISEYTNAVSSLDEYGALLCSVIKEVLLDASIQVHSITFRVKNYESVMRKLSIKSDKYQTVAELTDLLGVRIITYFPSDVDKVAKIVLKELKIDTVHSVDKRKILSPDQFGYLSLHYIATLTAERDTLTEYKRFKDKQFELQIRSILQHAWAEIEHDLGYKADGALPQAVQRRFFRLAGSLEGIDEDFERLRDEITQYEKSVDAIIKTAPQTLLIDQSTIVAALETESILIELDESIAAVDNRQLKADVDSAYAARQASELNLLGIHDVAELLSYAKLHKKHIVRFAELWIKGGSGTPFNRGIGLFYLGYILAAQMDKPLLAKWGWYISGRSKGLLDRVHTTWLKVVSELGQPEKLA